MQLRKFRVVAYTGENHSVREERFLETANAAKAAEQFAALFGQTVFPGRWEQPDEQGEVWSFGWTSHGQRIWVYCA